MKRVGFCWFVWVMLALGAGDMAEGHVGTLNVLFESQSPPAPARVSIRPPGIVPGLAEIDVRVLTNGVRKVSVLPVHWRAGLAGSPAPDVAIPVPGETNLFHAQLWLMAEGAYSVHVNVETEHGTNRLIVPLNSLATTRLPMTGPLGAILAVLGVLLFSLAVTIVGAAVRESVLAPGRVPDSNRIWAGRLAVAGGAVLLALALSGGRAWWNSVDRGYRLNRIYHPVACAATVREEGGQRVLHLNIQTNDTRATWTGLVPDHGKLMHLYLVPESMDGLAHLHPARRSHWEFVATLPAIAPGGYHVYADVTHETGLSQTLSTFVRVPPVAGGSPPAATQLPPDADDAWFAGQPSGAEQELGAGLRMIWEKNPGLVTGRPETLSFRVREADGQLAKLEPYLNMLGHAAIRSADGTVFMHLHPAGSVSVAAQQVFQIRADEQPVKRITPAMMEKFCQPPDERWPQQPLAFPCEFPKAGRYRVWVQVKAKGQPRTAVFDVEVR